MRVFVNLQLVLARCLLSLHIALVSGRDDKAQVGYERTTSLNELTMRRGISSVPPDLPYRLHWVFGCAGKYSARVQRMSILVSATVTERPLQCQQRALAISYADIHPTPELRVLFCNKLPSIKFWNFLRCRNWIRVHS